MLTHLSLILEEHFSSWFWHFLLLISVSSLMLFSHSWWWFRTLCLPSWSSCGYAANQSVVMTWVHPQPSLSVSQGRTRKMLKDEGTYVRNPLCRSVLYFHEILKHKLWPVVLYRWAYPSVCLSILRWSPCAGSAPVKLTLWNYTSLSSVSFGLI